MKKPYTITRWVRLVEYYQRKTPRAWMLLSSFLTPEQERALIEYGFFVVRGSTGRLFALTMAETFNIFTLGERSLYSLQYCVVSGYTIAQFDGLLAQKLWLESDEPKLLKRSNHDYFVIESESSTEFIINFLISCPERGL